jgi:MarR family transcriptional regulator for hemolysin
MAIRVEVPEIAEETVATTCLTTNLGWLLDQAGAVLSKELTLALEPLGLGSRGYCVLATALDQDHTQIELAKLIGVDKTTMVVTLDQLEAAGLAERRPSLTDRRVRVISVTKAGRRQVAQAREIVEQVQADVLARLPAGERAALLNGLNRIISE